MQIKSQKMLQKGHNFKKNERKVQGKSGKNGKNSKVAPADVMSP